LNPRVPRETNCLATGLAQSLLSPEV
jgi:hypothetical protein